jgi:hypothetical protein
MPACLTLECLAAASPAAAAVIGTEGGVQVQHVCKLTLKQNKLSKKIACLFV